jgi:hypothetical protein
MQAHKFSPFRLAEKVLEAGNTRSDIFLEWEVGVVPQDSEM